MILVPSHTFAMRAGPSRLHTHKPANVLDGGASRLPFTGSLCLKPFESRERCIDFSSPVQGVDQANASLKSSLNSVSKDAASMERQLEAAAAEKMGLVIALEEGKTLNNKLSQESERKALQADRLAKELESALTEAKLFTEQNTDLRR